MTANTKEVSTKTAAPATDRAEKVRPVYEPPADVIEKSDAIHLLLDMPGVDQKGLDVTVEEHVLRVSGKSSVTESTTEAALHREFEPADFERSFRLTQELDESKISASLKNGLLRLVLPKSEKAKPRQISIKVE